MEGPQGRASISDNNDSKIRFPSPRTKGPTMMMPRMRSGDSAAAQTAAHRSLQEIDVRPAVPFDQQWAIRGNSNVPAHYGAISESTVRLNCKSQDLLP